MKTVWLIIIASLLCSNEFLAPQAAAQDQTSTDPTTEKKRKTEAYLAPYLLGTFPVDKNLSIGATGLRTKRSGGPT